MNKNILLGIVAIILAIAAYLGLSKNEANNATDRINEERNFTIKNRNSLAGFRISKKTDVPYEFIKDKKGNWILNGKYLAEDLTVGAALAVFERARVEFIPINKAIPQILETMDEIGIKIEYLDENKNVINSYVIGSAAKDGETYFLRDGYKQPFAMGMSGFDGVLRSRFDHTFEKWRSTKMLDEEIKNIDSISVIYPKDRENSFMIKNENGTFKVLPKFSTTSVINAEPNASILDSYVNEYKLLYAEGFENSNTRQDSITSYLPFATIEVGLKDTIKKFDFYPYLTGVDPNLNPSAQQDAVKINRYYTKCNNGDFLLTQQYVVGKYFRTYRSFFN